MKQQRLTVAIIGAGPVGCVLGRALAAAGHIIAGVATSDERHYEQADTLMPGVRRAEPLELIDIADLVLLAIPGGQIEGLVRAAADAGLWRPGQIVAHTSTEPLEVLSAASAAGAIAIQLYPAMAFTGTSIDVARMHESYFAVAAPAVAVPIAQALVIEMGAEPIVIDEDQRADFFEAISFAKNFSALVVNQAIGLLDGIGVENSRAVIGGVVRSSVESALADGHVNIDPDELLEN